MQLAVFQRILMPKFLPVFILISFLLLSENIHAKWRLEKTNWLSDQFFSLVQSGEDKNTALFLSTNNMENYQFHLLLDDSTIQKKEQELPFVIKGEVYFDGVKHGTYELKKGLNVNKFKGADYEFNEDFLDAEVYEKLKFAKKFAFHYQGNQGKNHTLSG